jgi:hypothetical protein
MLFFKKKSEFIRFDLVRAAIGMLVSVLGVTYYAARKDGRRLGHAVRERALNCAAVKTLTTLISSSSYWCILAAVPLLYSV